MTVSIRRARQRAKTLAAEGGMTHQQALDSIARDEGHGTWAAMLSSQANPKGPSHVQTVAPIVASAQDPAAPILDPLHPAILVQGGDTRENAIRFMVDLVYSVSGDAVDRIVAETVIRSRVAWIEEGRIALDLTLPWFSDAVASLVSRWLDIEGDGLDEALKTGTYRSSSWQDHAKRDLAAAALEVGMPAAAAASLRMADAGKVGRQLERIVQVLQEVDADPAGSLSKGSLRRLPVEVAASIIRARVGDVSLSYWEASALRSALQRGDYESPLLRGQGARVLSIMSMQREIPRHVLSGMVDQVVSVGRPGEEEMPFAHVKELPQGSGPVERWLRDLVTKVRRGEQPFSYNPLQKPLDTNDREGLVDAVGKVVSLVPDHAPELSKRAGELIADTAFLAHRSGPDIVEIAGPRASSSVSLSSVRELIERHRADIGQLSLFASLGRLSDVSSFDRAEADPAIADLALEALAPF